MIRDLDATISKLLTTKAEQDSALASADISFEIPDSNWRDKLKKITVNCYLYDIHENLELKTFEPVVHRNPDKSLISVREAPRRIDCAYCITAWSTSKEDAVFEEHRILGQILNVLLRHRTMPDDVLEGDLINRIPPFPTVIASTDGMKNNPQFWGALDQRFKPSLNYIVTLAVMLDELPDAAPAVVDEVRTEVDHL